MGSGNAESGFVIGIPGIAGSLNIIGLNASHGSGIAENGLVVGIPEIDGIQNITGLIALDGSGIKNARVRKRVNVVCHIANCWNVLLSGVGGIIGLLDAKRDLVLLHI